MWPSDLRFGAVTAPNEEERAAQIKSLRIDLCRRLSLYNLAAFFAVADGLALVIPAALLPYGADEITDSTPQISDFQVSAISFAVCTHYILSRIFNVYSIKTICSGKHVIYRLLPCLLLTFMALMVVAVATKTSANYSRFWFFSWLAFSVGAALIFRTVALAYIRRAMSKGAYVYKALSIGVFCEPVRPKEIHSATQNEVRVMESIRLETIDALAQLAEKIAIEEIDRVYIAALWVDIPAVMRNLDLLRHLSTRVFVVPETGPDAAAGRLFVHGEPAIVLRDRGTNPWLVSLA